MKIISRVKVIYDSHELFPDAAFEKLGFFYGIICLALERALIRFSDQIIGVSIPQSIIMKRRYSLDDFLIIRNCPMINQPYTPENVPNNLVNINPSKINIVNSGSLIKGRGYFTFLGVIEMIKTIRNDFHVYILGDGPLMPFLANYIQDSKLADIVTMVGHVPKEFFFDILSKFDIGISLYEETPNNKYSQPNTVYDYMISGLAVIFPFYPGNIEVLGEIDAINITVSDKESIISAIEYLLENPDQIKLRGKKARKKFESKFNWEAINASLVNLYHEL